MSNDSPTVSNESAPLWVLTSDSIYRLAPEPEVMTIERVTGVRPPTPRQGADGTPHAFSHLYAGSQFAPGSAVEIPLVGRGMIVDWDGTGRATCTSPVVAVSERPMWGRSFWIQDPADLPDEQGLVVAAGRVISACPTVETAFLAAALLTSSTELVSGAALGLAASVTVTANGLQWSAFDDPNPVLAPVRDDGWRRPWDTPAGLLVT